MEISRFLVSHEELRHVYRTLVLSFFFLLELDLGNYLCLMLLSELSIFGIQFFSVARSFLSEIANLTPKYRQIRQLFGQKSRKNRQFLASFCWKIDPLPQNFQFLLHFYALIIFKIQKVKIKLVFEKK